MDLYRGINDLKVGQPRTNTVKDETSDLVADSHSILARWRNYFSPLLNTLNTEYIGSAHTIKENAETLIVTIK
jgi:hypothetical protein